MAHFEKGSVKDSAERVSRGTEDTSYSWIYVCCSDYSSRLDAYNEAQVSNFYQ